MTKYFVMLKNPLLPVLAAVLLTAPNLTAASPTDVHLTALPDYLALEANILPVTECNEALRALHPSCDDHYRVPNVAILSQLEVVGDSGSVLLDPHPGVLMYWGKSGDEGKEIIAAWELKLPQDPDFTGMCITLTAWPREGMTSISFSLKDAANVMKGWSWPVGGMGGLPVNQGTTVTVAASGGPGQAGSTGYWDGGIDLTQVVSLEFDESGIAQGGLILPNNLGPWVGQWNYWHDIIVFPCPPQKPEHFTCYKVREKTKLNNPPFVLLEDQFIKEDGVEVKKAEEICAPADKNGEGVKNDRDHLVCYQIKAKSKVDKLVKVENQFGNQELQVRDKLKKLCVPSTKEDIK